MSDAYLEVWLGDLCLTDYPFGVEWGSDFGAPQNVTEALPFLLQDGEIELSDRASNRTFAFTVILEGTDLAELADNEALLVAETEKPRAELTVSTSQTAPSTVYDTFRAQVTLARSEDEEINGLRRYALTIKAFPFGRSVDEVVAEAPAPPPPGGPTTVVINDGSSTIGWTGSMTVSSDGDVVRIDYPEVLGWNTHWLQWDGAAVDMTDTPYLQIEYSSFRQNPIVTVTADGTPLEYVGSQTASSGYTRAAYLCPDSSISSIRITMSQNAQSFLYTGTVRVDQIQRTDTVETAGTARESQRTIAVDGSARTQGTLVVEHETDALGDVLLYVFEDDGSGYTPAMTDYRTSGGSETVDASLVSGAYDNLNTQLVFDAPASAVPQGRYLAVARVRSAVGTGATLTCTASTRINSNDLGTTETWAASLLGVGTDWEIRALGSVMLPTQDLGTASSAEVRLTLVDAAPGSEDAIEVDEVWLFNMSIGSLVQATCGTGTPAAGGPSNRLFILPPNLITPRPRILRGFAADQSDAFYPGGDGVGAWGLMEFQPPQMAVFTVTTNAEDAAVSLRHYPRWHTHAAL